MKTKTAKELISDVLFNEKKFGRISNFLLTFKSEGHYSTAKVFINDVETDSSGGADLTETEVWCNLLMSIMRSGLHTSIEYSKKQSKGFDIIVK